MSPDVKNPRCACNGPGCPDCNFSLASDQADGYAGIVELFKFRCGRCGNTVEETRMPQARCQQCHAYAWRSCVPLEAASSQTATAQTGGPCAAGAEIAERLPQGDKTDVPAKAATSGPFGSSGEGRPIAYPSPLSTLDLAELAHINDEGENGWNAQRRSDFARKMQRIAGGGPNHFSHDELLGAVICAEEGGLR